MNHDLPLLDSNKNVVGQVVIRGREQADIDERVRSAKEALNIDPPKPPAGLAEAKKALGVTPAEPPRQLEGVRRSMGMLDTDDPATLYRIDQAREAIGRGDGDTRVSRRAAEVMAAMRRAK